MTVNDETLIFGLNGPTVVVKTGEEFKKLVENKEGIIRYLCCMCIHWCP